MGGPIGFFDDPTRTTVKEAAQHAMEPTARGFRAPRLIADVRRLIQTWLQEDSILEMQFTKLQGQYLAFIVAYTKLNRRAPAEADFQRYFDVTPPSVHNMIVTLDRRGLIKRTPGRARSIEIVMPLNEVPPLE
jgi:DNA-binding MarR family transcriptional regulator